MNIREEERFWESVKGTEVVLTDIEQITQKKQQGSKLPPKGWHEDFTDAPVGVFLLLKAKGRERIYRATLVRQKSGEKNRGICHTPWLEIEKERSEVQEEFVRDGIEAWYCPEDAYDYAKEVRIAAKMAERPHITCSRKFPDGRTLAMLENGITKEVVEIDERYEWEWAKIREKQRIQSLHGTKQT